MCLIQSASGEKHIYGSTWTPDIFPFQTNHTSKSLSKYPLQLRIKALDSRGKYDICMLCGAYRGLNWNASKDHTLDYLLYLPRALILRQPRGRKFRVNTE